MTQINQQIPIDFPFRPALGRDDLLVGAANKDAVAWVDRWPAWDRHALIIHGAAACGKTHLAAAWAEQSKAVIIPAGQLQGNEMRSLADNDRNIVIDGLDVWIGDRDSETAVFHLYNMFQEQKRSMVLTMRTVPSAIDFVLPDLASRLRSLPVATIHPPDDDMLSSIVIKLFHDRQIQVSVDVIRYIVPRMERSFAAAQNVVTQADQLALSRKTSITVPLMRSVFEDL